MGFPSNALSINDSSGTRRRLLKNLKSCESNSQQAFDENSLTIDRQRGCQAGAFEEMVKQTEPTRKSTLKEGVRMNLASRLYALGQGELDVENGFELDGE